MNSMVEWGDDFEGGKVGKTGGCGYTYHEEVLDKMQRRKSFSLFFLTKK